MSTPLTPEQYSELVCALEVLRGIYTGNMTLLTVKQPQALLCEMWLLGDLSAWAFIYLTQWFYLLQPWLPEGRDSIVWACAHMVAELCEERC